MESITMKAKSAIQKGKKLEEYLVSQLIEKGLDNRAYRSKGSGNGNGEKSDTWTSLMILGQNAGFECKNHKTVCIPEWWRQAKKLESLGREPVLVFKLPQDPLAGTLAVVYLDTLLELILATNGVKIEPTASLPYETAEVSRETRYKLERAKTAINDLIKNLNDL